MWRNYWPSKAVISIIKQCKFVKNPDAALRSTQDAELRISQLLSLSKSEGAWFRNCIRALATTMTMVPASPARGPAIRLARPVPRKEAEPEPDSVKLVWSSGG